MNETKDLRVTLDIDPERLAALQAALAFLTDICVTYGIDNNGAVQTDNPLHKHYGEALQYVTYLSAAIGEAVLDSGM